MKIRDGWETWAGIGAGVVALLYLPPDAYKEDTSEIVTVLGLVMAAIVPAMLLGATSLRAGRFSSNRLRRLYHALDVQIRVFGGLFLYGLFACLVVILGRTLGWHLPTLVLHLSRSISIDLSYSFEGLISGLLVFLSLRSISIIAGVRSILKLVAEMALDESTEREELQAKIDRQHLESYKLPPHYGEVVPLPEIKTNRPDR